jgi:hypothetical protein
LVRTKLAGSAPEATVAVTVYVPTDPLAVNDADVATPLGLVVAVFTPPAKVPLAPVDGTSNVTVTPLTGFCPPSNTVATNGAPNVVLTDALCGVPLVAVIDTSAPVIFVSVKLAADDTPATAAVTV